MADSPPQLQEPADQPDDLDLNAPQVIAQRIEEVPAPRFGDSPPWWAHQEADEDPADQHPTVAELVATAPDSVPDELPPNLVPNDPPTAPTTATSTPQAENDWPSEPAPTVPADEADDSAAVATAMDIPSDEGGWASESAKAVRADEVDGLAAVATVTDTPSDEEGRTFEPVTTVPADLAQNDASAAPATVTDIPSGEEGWASESARAVPAGEAGGSAAVSTAMDVLTEEDGQVSETVAAVPAEEIDDSVSATGAAEPPEIADGAASSGGGPDAAEEGEPASETAVDFPADKKVAPISPETVTDVPAKEDSKAAEDERTERPKVPATLVDVPVAGGGKISLPATVMDFPSEPLRAPEPPPHPGPAPQEVVDAVLASGSQPVVTGPQPVLSAPAARRGKAKPAVLLAMIAVLAVGLTAGAVGAFLYFSGPPDRKIVTPASVAGLRKDALVPAASAAYPFVAAAMENGNVTGPTKSAVYVEPAPGTRSFLIMGGTGPVGAPAEFLSRAKPSTVINSTKVMPGKNGGRASCGTFAVLSYVHAYCAWATENSYGFVAANTPSAVPQPAELADLMRRVRKTVEKER